MAGRRADYQEVLEEFNDHRDEPVDTNDFMEAIERSKRRFHVVENEQELLQMLNAPLEKWRVFLHRASENWWSRPLMVRYEYWAVQVQENGCCNAPCAVVISASGR